MRARLLTATISVAACWLALCTWTGLAIGSRAFLAPLALVGVLLVVSGAVVRLRFPGRLSGLAVQVPLLLLIGHRVGSHAWFPTHGSISTFVHRFAAGVQQVEVENSPVAHHLPATHLLLLCAGAGLLLVAEFFSGGLRRPIAAGLPMLVAVAVPSSALKPALPLALLVVPVVLWLAAIAVDHNRAWRVGLVAPASLIGIGVIVAGSVVPQLLPVRVFHQGGNGGGNGPTQVLTMGNPMLDLQRNLIRGENLPLVYARTNSPDTSYLRLAVLTQFDGSSWRPAVRSPSSLHQAYGRLPVPPGVTTPDTRKQYRWFLQVAPDFRSIWLPVPTPTLSINEPGLWQYDLRTLDINGVGDQTSAGLGYTVEAGSRPALAARISQPPGGASTAPPGMTALPPNLPAVFGRLARQITAGATTEYAKAVRLQQWFRSSGGFTYSLTPGGGYGIDELVSFVTTDKVGYCEQFSAAMAIMARSVGIPARIGVGFLSPRPAPATSSGATPANEVVYTAHDMHAWPELYFPQAGWLPFEPTPGERAGSVPAYTVPPQRTTPTQPSAAPQPSVKPLPQNKPLAGQEAAKTPTHRVVGGIPVGLLTTTAWLLLAGLVLTAPRMLRRVRRLRRWRQAAGTGGLAEVAWQEVRDSALDAGLTWSDKRTVRRTAQELRHDTRADAAGQNALGQIVGLVEVSRYGRPSQASPDTEELHRLRADVQEWVRTWDATVLESLDGATARRARWLPRSLVAGRRR